MSGNPSKDVFEKQFIKRIKDLENTVSGLIANQNSFFFLPRLSSDPTAPQDGQIWYNTTSNTFKCRQNGVTKTFTVS